MTLFIFSLTSLDELDATFLSFMPATHSKDETSALSRLDTHEIGAIIHPKLVHQNFDADQFTFRKVFWKRFSVKEWFLGRLYKAFVFVKVRPFPFKAGRSV
jgi:hypothetical protein